MNLYRYSLGLVLSVAISLAGCEECEEFNPPVGKDATFTIEENSNEGAVVGTVEGNSSDGPVEYSIVGGDPEDVFNIDPSTGTIALQDSSKLDFEKVQQFDLSIRLKNNSGESSSQIKINIEDMTPTSENLVSHYKFQNEAHDEKGTNHGMTNYVAYVPRDLGDNLAASFPGYGNIPLPQFFDFQKRTVSVWLMVREIAGEYQIIYSSDGPSVEYGMTILSVIKSGSAIDLTYNVSNVLNVVPVNENIWYNATFVVDGMSYSLYLNGEKFFDQTFLSYVKSGNSDYDGAVLGSSRATERFFSGLADDVRIYNRPLSDREVELIYHEEPR